MAKIVFDNKFLLTRKLHKQYCKKAYKNSRKRIRITCLILTAIFLASAFALYTLLNWKVFAIILGLLAGYFLLMSFIGYTFSEWVNFGKLKDEHAHAKGCDVVLVITFEPVNVHVKFGKTQFSFKYTSIDSAYETDDLIVLVLKHPGMIEHSQILYKKGFTNKDDNVLDSFKEFINEKAGKAVFELA